MDAEAQALLRDRSSRASDWSAVELAALKSASGTTVSVVLPALNEAETVGSIVETVRERFVDGEIPLVDEVVVLDSGSTDATSAVAANAGARVLHRDDVLPHIPGVLGKGEAMWRAVAATDSDIVVFIDADLRSFDSGYVVGLLGPLLTNESIAMVKATYQRPLIDGSQILGNGGGRVTELVARPLLNLYWPKLAGVMQPLAGEYAARRSLLEHLRFPCGYGVEFALLVDTAEAVGVEGIAQVDLGVRLHRHHDDQKLGQMSAEILQAAISRMDSSGQALQDREIGTTLWQFETSREGSAINSHDVSALERPPLVSVPEYAVARLSASRTQAS